MPTVSFHPGFNGVLLLAAAGLAMIVIAAFYARAFRALRPVPWAILYGLRMFAVALVLLLLFRPVFSFQRESRERAAMVLLVDRSASMGIADDAAGATRFELALDRLPGWVKKLSTEFETHLLSFSDSATQVASLDELPKLKADGQATSLSRALSAAMQVKSSARLDGVFLISDGVHNSAGDPLAVAQRIGVPVYTIGVGNALRDRSTSRDVRVVDIEVPPQMALQNLARVKAYVDAVGFPGRVVKATLSEDGKQVAETEVVLDDAEGAQEIAFDFTPTVKGVHNYRVQIPPATEEKIPENNERSASSLVNDARIRVLYVEGTLRAEYGALVGRFLAKDPNVEYCALVQTRPNVFVRRSNISGLELTTIPQDRETLAKFDVFIMGDLDSTYLRQGQLEGIRDRVKQGAGLIMLGGYHSLGPGGYRDTALAELLPVQLGDRNVGQASDPFHLQLTAEGRQHPIFANIAQFFPGGEKSKEVSGLPQLEGCVRVLGASPAATILATHPKEKAGGSPMPVMAVQPFGEGRTAVFTADTTRNWHQTLRTMDRETPFLRFWGQAIRWLARRDGTMAAEAGVTATTDKAYYEPESSVRISAVVRGKEGEAAGGATVTVAISGPDKFATELKLTAVSGPAGNYEAVFDPQRSGHYELLVKAAIGDASLQAPPLQIDVGRPNLEFDRLELDEKMLIALADGGHGRYSHLTTADRLIDRLCSGQEKRKIQYEIRLAWPPVIWPLFVLALTAEWILRRRFLLR